MKPHLTTSGVVVPRGREQQWAEAAVREALDVATISRCREMLGDEANALSDKDVDQIRRHADALARLIVEVFQKQGHSA